MSSTAYVQQLPMCDIHKYEHGNPNIVARYDGRTVTGQWANMCDQCFASHGTGLGTGYGQELVIGDEPETTPEQVHDAISRGAIDEVWDLVGDGDILDFI